MTSTLVKKENRLLPLAGNVEQVVRSFQPDIVHDNGIWLSHNHSLARLAAHYNLPRVVSIRGMLEPWALAHKRVKKKLAWSAVRPQGWRLRIHGPGASGYCDEVARRIDRAGLERQVSLGGPLYGAAKTQAFTSADAFLLPSHSENFGIVVAEALAHGVPVLTTTATPWQALESEHCGWWVPPTSEAIARGLAEVVAASDETRKAMGMRGRALVKRQFAWRAIAKNMRASYESIVEESRAMGRA